MIPPSSLAEFVVALRSTGCPIVTRGQSDFDDRSRAEDRLRLDFQEVLEEMPDSPADPLVWHPAAAVAAAEFVYRVCQALVDRTLPEEAVRHLATTMPPAPASAGEALSVDLVLRHLPVLHGMARALSPDDPLVRVIEAAAARFPLSGIGVRKDPPTVAAELPDHPQLRHLFLDRVIEHQDEAAVANDSVRAAVTDALGEHAPLLAPRLAARLALLVLPPAAVADPSIPASSVPASS